MPYEVIEKEIENLTDVQKKAVFLFVRFLASQDSGEIDFSTGRFGVSLAPVPSTLDEIKGKERKLGGFEKDFYMAPDFDEPLADFAEYM